MQNINFIKIYFNRLHLLHVAKWNLEVAVWQADGESVYVGQHMT